MRIATKVKKRHASVIIGKNEVASPSPSFLCPRPIVCRLDFHKIYQLGAIIGKGAFCTVHLATVKVDGPYKGMQVAVKCTERQNLRSLDEENLKEEVRKSASMHRRT